MRSSVAALSAIAFADIHALAIKAMIPVARATMEQQAEAGEAVLGNRQEVTAAEIRWIVAAISNASEPNGSKGRHPKFDLIVGDEGGLPDARIRSE